MNAENQILQIRVGTRALNLNRHAAAVSHSRRKPLRCLRFLLFNSVRLSGLALAAAVPLLPGGAHAPAAGEPWLQPYDGPGHGGDQVQVLTPGALQGEAAVARLKEQGQYTALAPAAQTARYAVQTGKA